MVRSSGLETYSVESSSMFFVPAGQITTIESVSRNAKGFYCHFDTSMLIERFANLQLVEEFAFLRTTVNPVMPLPAKTISRLVYLFERINEEQASTMAEGIIQSYLLTIFFEVKQYHLPGVYTATSPAQRLNEKFKQLVTSDFKSRKTVAEYAHLLSVTPNHLNKSVKSASGKSPSVWIDESIILEAKVLLYQSGLTVAEISYEMGLDDPSYFGRLFKKYTGMTPTEFRNRAKIRKDSSR